MIKNQRQLKITEKKLIEFEEIISKLKIKYKGDDIKFKLFSSGIKEQIKKFKKEIKEYNNMLSSPIPKILRAHNSYEISQHIVRLRLANGLTQAELAKKINCKQSDISRLEKEDYKGYSLNLLLKISKSLNTNLEINFLSNT